MKNERVALIVPKCLEVQILQLTHLREMRRHLTAAEISLSYQIKESAGRMGCDDLQAECEGDVITIAKIIKASHKFDLYRFKQEHEDLYIQYSSEERKELHIQPEAILLATKQESKQEKNI